MAELLELTGAAEISAAVKFQVAAMKGKTQANTAGALADMKQQQLLQQRRQSMAAAEPTAKPTATSGSLAAVLAAKKLKRNLVVCSSLVDTKTRSSPAISSAHTHTHFCLHGTVRGGPRQGGQGVVCVCVCVGGGGGGGVERGMVVLGGCPSFHVSDVPPLMQACVMASACDSCSHLSLAGRVCRPSRRRRRRPACSQLCRV